MKFRKIATFVATLAMVVSMSATAFAANYAGDAIETSDTTLNIPKSLVVSNPNLATVDGPGLTYSYTLASVTPSATNGGTTITDKETPSHTGTVHAGPAGGVSLTTASVAFPVGEDLNASASGTANTKNIVAAVDLATFGTTPGIYRYSITEAASVTPETVGVHDTNNAEGRYLDVYIVRNANDQLEVGGYVVHDGTTEAGAPASKRSFDDSTFPTYNITLSKTVSGNMGDRAHQFGFAGTIVDNARSFYAKKETAPSAAATDKIAGAAAGSAVSTTLCHQETYYISGLTDQATVTYTETNDTSDVYQTGISGATGITNADPSAVAAGSTKAFSNAVNAKDNAAAVTFTNTLETVSPTGVVMRYGAPLLILAAAVVLIALNRKSRKAGAEK